MAAGVALALLGACRSHASGASPPDTIAGIAGAAGDAATSSGRAKVEGDAGAPAPLPSAPIFTDLAVALDRNDGNRGVRPFDRTTERGRGGRTSGETP